MKVTFDKNNLDDIYFFGSIIDKHKAEMRKVLRDLLKEGEITEDQRKNMFNQIDKGETKLLISESKSDYDGKKVKKFINLSMD